MNFSVSIMTMIAAPYGSGGRSLHRLALAWLALPLAACGTSGPAYGPPSPGDASVVEMTSALAFVPNRVQIRAGQTVEWRNRSLFRHTVRFDPAKEDNVQDPTAPRNIPAFEGNVPAGQILQHTFAVPGTYHYYCEPHEGSGMKGIVIVTSAQ